MKAPWVAFAIFATLCAGLFAAHAVGYRLNTTASLPVGIYRLMPLDGRPVEPGQFVVFCLPDGTDAARQAATRGYLPTGRARGPQACPHALAPLMKPVAGVAGDRVEDAGSKGITINGNPVPHSGRLVQDPAGRPLAAANPHYSIQAGHIVVLAPQPRSFDSRYFGPVAISALQGAAVPVLLF